MMGNIYPNSHASTASNIQVGDADEPCNHSLGLSAAIASRSFGQNDPEPGPSITAPLPEYTPQPRGQPAPFPISLNVVIQVVGSRGDVQPFLALGNALVQAGHRVRLATHDVFESFVLSSSSSSDGVEFFPVGGDPAELMAYMVSSPNLIPSMAALREGAVSRKRRMYEGLLQRFWDACVNPDPRTGRPFVADAIIANPPSFAHVHCAEALGVPVHLMFTMPWSSTGAFPQPLAGLRAKLGRKGKAKATEGRINQVSYAAMDFLTWQGLGDLVNNWRGQMLDLEPVPATEGPRLIDTLKVPFTYCWSPSLVPRPADWGPHIDVCGFFFRDPEPYTPPTELSDFLDAGPPPVYIGFGSIVVGDAEGLMTIVLGAVKEVGVRAIISRGWSNLTGGKSSDVFYVGDCPHEWLFQHVAAVVHHGGAGTTACGLRNGRPSAVVPFFGDQYFWGTVIHQAGAGPPPLPYESLTSQKLAEAMRFCLSPEASEAAANIACNMATEGGVAAAVDSFHRHLPLEEMRCDFFPNETAAWVCGRGRRKVKMCRAVATILRNHGRISSKDVRLHRNGNVVIENRRWEPLTAVSSASLATIMGVADAAAGIVRGPIEEYRKPHPKNLAAGIQGSWNGCESASDAKPVESATITVAGAAATFSLQRRASADRLLVPPDRPSEPTYLRPTSAHEKPRPSTARAMVSASARSFGKVVARTTRGVLVDIPVAATEGMRAVPQLWGEPVSSHAQVRDVHSGGSVACRSFYEGFSGAMTEIFLRTYQAKKERGAVGAAQGLAQGTMGMATKMGSAVVGLVAYPAQGLANSIRAKAKPAARRRVMEAKWKEGEWLLENSEARKRDHAVILEDFEGLRGRR